MGVVGGEAIDMHGCWTRHRFDAAANNHVLEARQDAHRCEVHCLLARAAEAVEGDAGSVERPTSVERCHAGDVHCVVAAASTTTHHDIVDLGGVETIA
ncbi:unannotated protein [freshwater metagenome]|uniref:Unannotated protein n=1 Tax=freshwater metagenome TaxID=449393 RepID=A0A6J6XPJ9_9ZZZZ